MSKRKLNSRPTHYAIGFPRYENRESDGEIVTTIIDCKPSSSVALLADNLGKKQPSAPCQQQASDNHNTDESTAKPDKIPDGASEREYVVEKILKKRFRNRRIEYLLKWEGYPMEQCSWEPLHHINADTLIIEYERELAEKKSKRKA